MKSWEFIFLFSYLFVKSVNTGRCDRRPYGAITQPSPSDGRVRLEVVDTLSYIPGQLYVVRLSRTDDETLFTDFMITAEGEQRRNPQTKRTTIMDSGFLSPMNDLSKHTTNRAGCHNTLEQQSSAPKDAVEVYWTAPSSGSGCVTLLAMVAINDVVWFEGGGALMQRICEDSSQPDDVSPVINMECSICEDAKYEVSFTGIWSRNTHPTLFPDNEDQAYSELVGASHSVEWSPWVAGGMASEGLKQIAEYANGSKLEKEIFAQISEGNVRTMIKGKGHKGYEKMSRTTYSYFRTDKNHHLVTVAVGFYPSPDWFLGVSRFELCTSENKWMEDRELNLYPWDAGTDNGISYESPNIPTYPQDIIERVKMSSNDKNSPFYELDMKNLHPFGKLHFRLIRTYDRGCDEVTEEEEGVTPAPEEGGDTEDQSEPEEPSSEAPILVDPEAPEDCPLSQWSDWSECDGTCEKGLVKGYRYRERYFLVNGEPANKYDPGHHGKEAKIPKHCRELNYMDVEDCEEEKDCDKEEEGKADRRVMGPLAPGQGWSNKRSIKKPQPTFLPTNENFI
ncbi:hypothetical protein NE865_13371 [Phthorimaea operculella]|nr:hypothetical protein NE865_13371 [Phthorimaea operculella]